MLYDVDCSFYMARDKPRRGHTAGFRNFRRKTTADDDSDEASEATWYCALCDITVSELVDSYRPSRHIFLKMCLYEHSLRHLLHPLRKCSNQKDRSHPCKLPECSSVSVESCSTTGFVGLYLISCLMDF